MENSTIIQALKKFMGSTDSSQNMVAAMSGISPGTISNMLTGTWEGIHERQWNKLAAFLKVDNWKHVNTLNYEIIADMCADAKLGSRCLALAADTGYGKTDGLEDFSRSYSNSFYVLCDSLMSGKRIFLDAIQRAMGIMQGGSPYEMLDAICDRLNSLTEPVLLFDDAGKLNDSNLRLIQLIYDKTFRRAGIVLTGMPYLKTNIERGVKKNKMGFSELYRRIENWKTLMPPSREEMKHLIEANGITDKMVITAIISRSKNFGTVRAFVMNAQRLQKQGKLSAETLFGIKKEIAA